MKLADRGPLYGVRRSFIIEDQFPYYIDLDLWTKLASDGGSSVAHVGDGVPPTVLLTTGATNNNECMLRSTNESFLFAADKPIFGSVRLQYAEANTDDAAIFAGFVNAAGADLIPDGGASMKTTASGFGIYKRKDATVWRAWSSLSTTQTDTASTKTAGGSAYQVLEFEAEPVNSTEVRVTYKVDGQELLDSNGNKIAHLITFSGATEMHFVPCYVKAGGANSETPEVSGAYASQLY